jgi:hypothetical protein
MKRTKWRLNTKDEDKFYIIIYGVAERWVNIGFNLKKIKDYNPSDNADMSNEKGKNPSPKAYGFI